MFQFLSSLVMPVLFFVGMSSVDAQSTDNTTAVVADSVEYLKVQDADCLWLMFGAVLVFYMQTGFAMLEVGSVQVKNTKNILIKNVFDASIGALAWWISGYGIALGSGTPRTIAGSDSYGLEIGLHDKAMWLFQWAFCATAATIVSGAVAERITFSAYILISVALTAFIYPVVVHVGWGAGTFSAWRESDLFIGCGVTDFAGSGVVHATGGIAAFVSCYLLGPRIGRYVDGKPKTIPQQSIVYQTLGTLILWLGWYGFNGVSTLFINGYSGVAAHTMVTTTIAAATGCLATTGIGYLHEHIISPNYANNGVLAGLVSITAGCSTCSPAGAFFIGLLGSPIYYYSNKLLVKFQVDDVVGSVPVHGFCGVWGVIAAALFATPGYYSSAYYGDRADKCAGLFYGGDGSLLVANALFIAFLFAWVGGLTTAVVLPLKCAGLLRVSEETEMEGMDNSKHGGTEQEMERIVPGEV